MTCLFLEFFVTENTKSETTNKEGTTVHLRPLLPPHQTNAQVCELCRTKGYSLPLSFSCPLPPTTPPYPPHLPPPQLSDAITEHPSSLSTNILRQPSCAPARGPFCPCQLVVGNAPAGHGCALRERCQDNTGVSLSYVAVHFTPAFWICGSPAEVHHFQQTTNRIAALPIPPQVTCVLDDTK